MLGALGTKLLTQIQQAVCCISQRVSAAPDNGAALTEVYDFPITESAAAYSMGATDVAYTSIEVENFSDTFWIKVTPLGMAATTNFWVAPGTSKVLASSGAIFPSSGDIVCYDALTGSVTYADPAFKVQVTLMK